MCVGIVGCAACAWVASPSARRGEGEGHCRATGPCRRSPLTLILSPGARGEARKATRSRDVHGNRRNALRTRRFEPSLTYFFGEAAGLAASFFAPLPAFTSTSVAD